MIRLFSFWTAWGEGLRGVSLERVRLHSTSPPPRQPETRIIRTSLSLMHSLGLLGGDYDQDEAGVVVVVEYLWIQQVLFFPKTPGRPTLLLSPLTIVPRQPQSQADRHRLGTRLVTMHLLDLLHPLSSVLCPRLEGRGAKDRGSFALS